MELIALATVTGAIGTMNGGEQPVQCSEQELAKCGAHAKVIPIKKAGQ